MSEAFDAVPGEDAVSAEDARLLERLGQALGPDRPPAGLVGRAEGLLAFATVDRELAELLEPAAAEPVGVRGPAVAGEPLLFEVSDSSIAIELSLADDRLHGQILAGTPVEVVLERLTGPAGTCPVDELGRFGFDRPPAGPARLRLLAGPDQVRNGSERPVTTDWFLL